VKSADVLEPFRDCRRISISDRMCFVISTLAESDRIAEAYPPPIREIDWVYLRSILHPSLTQGKRNGVRSQLMDIFSLHLDLFWNRMFGKRGRTVAPAGQRLLAHFSGTQREMDHVARFMLVFLRIVAAPFFSLAP
jgi:hypothetical protein